MYLFVDDMSISVSVLFKVPTFSFSVFAVKSGAGRRLLISLGAFVAYLKTMRHSDLSTAGNEASCVCLDLRPRKCESSFMFKQSTKEALAVPDGEVRKGRIGAV
ncbi:hypothetical protein E6O75_ATG01584 [Venturia nashicola]|uniref:Uncharacterized protein n=1 Tax=Venturia nashicola TaxID=86259 RepID=A0A4Z1PMH9_9PEZI|nr:hypothetical protein E6O75_ATG01584 [Venturia nashicola]